MTLRREFKHIGKTVNAVGYGAMSLSNFYGSIDHKGCLDIVAACYDLGVDHLDTANLYGRGNSETVIGEYLRDNPAARDFFTIATKGGSGLVIRTRATMVFRTTIAKLSLRSVLMKAFRNWASIAWTSIICTGGISGCRLRK